MRRKTLQQYDPECAALLRPAGFERRQPDGAGNSYSWEKTFPDGSATSITYGENNPIGAPALPYWSMLHCFADARFLLSSNLTLPDALSETSHFELCAESWKLLCAGKSRLPT